jgi:multiple sugar transport system ATP-binding protein
MASIQLRGLRKAYSTDTVAVDGVDLTVADGEVLVLLGPTGCGKSTVLRLIAGLEEPTAGEVLFDGVSVGRLGAGERGVAMVFQDYALYPHLTVAQNIGFPLLHLADDVRVARIAEVARTLRLDGVLHRRPTQLSGGQRQRLAMARAIARPPRVFLLDQPLSNLDAVSRDAVRADVLDLIRRLGVTTVYVTHDHDEAMVFADRLAVMRRGRIEQVGTPAEIYADPDGVFVAAFVGDPRMNLLQAAVYAEPEVRVVVDLGPQTVMLPWTDPWAATLAAHHTERVTVGVRPDAPRLVDGRSPAGPAPVPDPTGGADPGPGEGPATGADPVAGPDVATLTGLPGVTLTGPVRLVELRGHEALVHLETGCAPTPFLQSHLEFPDSPGELAHVLADQPPLPPAPTMVDRLLRLVPQQRRPEERTAHHPAHDARQETARQALGDFTVLVPAAAAPKPGETVSVTVDVDRLYFFDRDGERIELPSPRGREKNV